MPIQLIGRTRYYRRIEAEQQTPKGSRHCTTQKIFIQSHYRRISPHCIHIASTSELHHSCSTVRDASSATGKAEAAGPESLQVSDHEKVMNHPKQLHRRHCDTSFGKSMCIQFAIARGTSHSAVRITGDNC
jgi:uncharacterized protein YgiB involved in biofilm formation